ncbi:MAG: hypothetical protein WKF97_05060 [Chitinophagaceae bacterium]
MTRKLLICIPMLILLVTCKPGFKEVTWEYTDKDVVGVPPAKSDQINMDVYVDATTSMEGFAVSNASHYSQFIDQLEASALSAWRKADPAFFKFGQIIRPVDRTEFLSAKNNLTFYREKGVYLKTFIDSVVNRTDPKRLSVLVTDLFQDEGDVNIMVERFKEKCFARGVVVGIAGVKSDFKGKVYDVPNYPRGYDLDSKERPFYAIIFGNQYNMELLFEALKTKPFVKEEQFLVFSNHIIKSYEAKLVKSATSRSLVNKAQRGIKNVFDFTLKKEGKETPRFNLEIMLNRNTRCADFSAKDIEPVVFKKSMKGTDKAAGDSSTTSDISVTDLQRTGDKLTATIVLNNEDEPGNFSYVIYLKANQLNGLLTPKWIRDFSTDNPVPNTITAAKTYNLEKLSSTLLVANATVSPTYIGKIYLNIYKR